MKKILFLTAIAALIFTGCNKADEYPVVKTVAIYSDGTTVTVIGNLSDDGSGKTSAGVCWSTKKNPYKTDEHIEKERKKGEYTTVISDLEVGKEYYFRSYATNNKGTSYGNQYSFTLGDPIIVTGGNGGVLEEMAGRFSFSNVTKLNISGYINKQDFDYLRDGMPNLADIDMSKASVAGYTDKVTSIKYVANNIPVWAFATDKGNNVPGDNNKLTSVVLPETIWYIDDYAFAGCKKLRGGVEIPVGVKIIGENAYYGCTSIGNLTLYDIEKPNSSALMNIEEGAFNGCSGLIGTLSIPATVNKIGRNAFNGCNGFERIEVSWTTPLEYTENMLPMKDVYVPAGSENAYRTAAGWSAHNILTKTN